MSEKTTNRRSRKVNGDEMRTEYDFAGAVRGKYHRAYTQSTNVVVLEPDVAKRFKNATAVNKALRSIMRDETERRGLITRSTRPSRKRAAG